MPHIPSDQPAARVVSSHSPESCPLNHGLAIVDQLLAAISRTGGAQALDAALDFRLLLADLRDPAAVLRGYFVLRGAVETRHHAACIQLRRWLEARFLALVEADRDDGTLRVGLKLDVPSFGSLYAHCAARASDGRSPAPWRCVQFVPAESANALALAGEALRSGRSPR